MRKPKPNTTLPKGAVTIEPVEKKIGAWNVLTYDAKVKRLGIIWYRVKDGLAGKNDREDWLADVPLVCVSVHDYHWNGDSFGANHGSFDNAIKAETKYALSRAQAKLLEVQNRLSALRVSVSTLMQAQD